MQPSRPRRWPRACASGALLVLLIACESGDGAASADAEAPLDAALDVDAASAPDPSASIGVSTTRIGALAGPYNARAPGQEALPFFGTDQRPEIELERRGVKLAHRGDTDQQRFITSGQIGQVEPRG